MDMTKFGAPLPDWTVPVAPDALVLEGKYARLERLNETHAHHLYRAFAGDDAVWDYMSYGPFPSEVGYLRFIKDMAALDDPFFYTVFDKDTGLPGGVMSFLRISPPVGVIELGHICLSAQLRRSRVASEAMILMMDWVFGAGYRRFEWKCDTLNMPSRRAAQRLGLSYEGTIRQATIVKGRNRDTAWFAATDQDWPGLRVAYDVWLSIRNFDETGQQQERLSDLTRLVRVSSDPLQADV